MLQTRVPTTIRLDPKTYHAARVAAVVAGIPVGEWIEEAIKVKLDNKGREP